MESENRQFDSRRVDAKRTTGPKGGMTMWAAWLDGEPFVMGGRLMKADTKRAARGMLLDYIRRHPEKSF